MYLAGGKQNANSLGQWDVLKTAGLEKVNEDVRTDPKQRT